MFGVLAIIALGTGFVKTSPWKWVVTLIAFTGLYSSILRHTELPILSLRLILQKIIRDGF
jgi:EamA domain-containing membrane protein RarD